jgi:hypothetical protein
MITFIDELENDATEVAHRLVKLRDTILDALAPDGRGFQEAKATEREQVQEYVTLLRGNPAAWEGWIMTRATQISAALGGLPPDVVAEVHPWDIAQRYALDYSAHMEKALEAHRG